MPQVVRIVRRTMASVAGGGPSNFDGRDRYKLAGRELTKAEEAERVRWRRMRPSHAGRIAARFGAQPAANVCAPRAATC